VTISNEKTQSTEMIQNNSEEYKTPPKKSLVMTKRSKSNVNDLQIHLFEKSINSSDSEQSMKNEELDDIFDKVTFKLSPKEINKHKKHASQHKNDKSNNLNIFKRLIETDSYTKKKDNNKLPQFAEEELYIPPQSFIKENNGNGVINSTFHFDDKKENDVVLCISNINNCDDFLENSLDSNFKKDFLQTEKDSENR